MRAANDLPRRRRTRTSRRGRIVLIALVVVLILLISAARGIAGFYTDYLWFDALGYEGVFTGVLGAKVALSVLFTAGFFVMMFASLLVADRLAPRFLAGGGGPSEDFVERYRQLVGRRTGLVRAGVSLALALVVGLGTSSQWHDWVLFSNRVDFGIKDPQFNRDVGFYVFELPFWSFVVSWGFAALVIITVVTAVFHYLNGGIRVQGAAPRVTPQVKMHLSVLLALLALVKAAGYYLQRFQLVYSTRGAVDGASYTDVKAQLPAINLLLLVSVLAAVLLILNIWRRGWVLPVISVGLWALLAGIVGAAYPAFVQRFLVQPNEATREVDYIARNIAATRAAFGLTEVETVDFSATDSLTATQVQANIDTLRNIRVLDPNVVGAAFQRLQGSGLRAFYTINDLDPDRYEVDGEARQVVVAARELNAGDLPVKSWVGKHLQYTHGYGLAVASANKVQVSGSPDFLVKDLPPVGEPELTRPEVYFGEGLDEFAIVGTKQAEISYIDPATGQPVTTQYTGSGGVELNSFVRQAAFALRFGNINPLISKSITDDSRILYVRDVHDRVRMLAPFLDFDADPYPVVLDGKLYWIVDGYTTTSRYPYAQRAVTEGLPARSDLTHRFNYIRNSVKVVVDAYNGTVTMYVVDPDDPLVKAYAKAFPDLFTDASELPAGIREHFRYPEDMFRVQTAMWGSYHIDSPSSFYSKSDAWAVAQRPSDASGAVATTQTSNAQGTVSSKEVRIDPFYQLMRVPGGERQEYVLTRPFVPFSGQDTSKQLASLMVASSDPESYGRLRVFRMPSNNPPDGPSLVASKMLADPEVSKELTLLNQQGSSVIFGNLLQVPIEGAFVDVWPLYVSASNTAAVPELKRVIVRYNGRNYIRPTLQDALEAALGPLPDLGGIVDAEGEPVSDGGTGGTGGVGPTTTTTTTVPGATTTLAPAGTVSELLARAQEAFTAADAALRAGDLATYQRKVQEAEALVAQALAQSGGAPASTTVPVTTVPVTTVVVNAASTTAPPPATTSAPSA